jgi:hypothetical protein
LVDAGDILLSKRDMPLAHVPSMRYGSKPVDGGHLLLSNEEKADLQHNEPKAKKYIRQFLGADEFLYGIERWCLWLKGISPTDLKLMPLVLKRVEAVKKMRLESAKEPTREMAAYPTLFAEDRQPDSDYIIVPEVSSEKRNYLPIGFVSKDVVSSNLNYTIPNATLFVFGVISSSMHTAWIRHVAGRLESRYRYSSQIVYNNFPWPEIPAAVNSPHPDDHNAPASGTPPYLKRGKGELQKAIEQAAQGVLDARDAHQDSSLADLYDPVAMPPDLRKAHQALDRAVDVAYGKKNFASDAERVAFLFELYHQYTSLLPSPKSTVRKQRKGVR